MIEDNPDVIPLEGYQVVAIRGEGVWIANRNGDCWHVGGPCEAAPDDNQLVADYRAVMQDD